MKEEYMKKNIVILGVLVALVFCVNAFHDEPTVIPNATLSKSFLHKKIPIIDIRTQQEWRETGTVPGSHLITFYKEDKTFDEEKFMKQLQLVVNKEDKFAILCRSGNRSNRVSRFLNSKGYIHVINLAGGIKMGKKNHIKLMNI